MWCPQDKQGFFQSQFSGQVGENDVLKKWCYDVKTYL